MLTIVPTPIGNIKDITLRALEILKESDFILCEDTRKTRFLINHYSIATKLVAFHMHNEKKMESSIIQDLEGGKKISLVSDAGTPSINDPGTSLIQRCHKENIPVSALPGACSVTTALSLSGLFDEKFQFIGFFPKKEKEKKDLIEQIVYYDGITIFFESPKRINKTIALFPKGQTIYIAKELSKIYESLITVTPENKEEFSDKLSKGEMCVLIKGIKKGPTEVSVEDQMVLDTLNEYVSKRDAIKIASTLTGKKKQCFYSL